MQNTVLFTVQFLQLLLTLAHNIFEESTSLDGLVQKIMLDAQDVLQCDRCCVFLVDEDTDGVISNYM